MPRSEFCLSVTPRAIFLGLLLLAVSTYLGWTGLTVLQQFHPSDPSRWVFACPSLCLGAVTLLLTGLVPLLCCRGRIRVDAAGVHYRGMHFPWHQLQIHGDRWGPLGRRLRLLHRDGPQRLDLYELFLPHLEELEKALQLYKRRVNLEHDSVVSID